MSDSAGAVKDRSTKVLARFTGAPSVTPEKYDESIKRLKATESQWPPDGLAYHVAFKSGGSFRVSEIWDSREQFDTFGKRLMPILTDVGIERAAAACFLNRAADCAWLTAIAARTLKALSYHAQAKTSAACLPPIERTGVSD
jgi:hypothetical protein